MWAHKHLLFGQDILPQRWQPLEIVGGGEQAHNLGSREKVRLVRLHGP
jgi:hypothetical protein